MDEFQSDFIPSGFLSDRFDDASARTEDFDGADSYMGQFSNDDDSIHSMDSARHLTIDNPNDVGHVAQGPRPSDTCPHICVVLNQNVNGLGERADDKLEKIIEMMIDR